jgi:hypothetical protein
MQFIFLQLQASYVWGGGCGVHDCGKECGKEKFMESRSWSRGVVKEAEKSLVSHFLFSFPRIGEIYYGPRACNVSTN